MSAVLISPYAAIEATIRRYRPTHLVSLMVEPEVQTPEAIRPECHLRLSIHDVTEAGDGITCPEHSHISSLLEFTRSWNRSSPILIHCWAGISRSTAAAYIVLCDLQAAGDEYQLAQSLRFYAPHAQPNRLMIRHADALLARQGRMTAAVECMSPPIPAVEGTVVEIPLRPESG
ncbi:MAG TPA: protein-tyrosine phosphatase family protein [Micropepsaceae bacterium]|nr:protein-tyrosine phosphatase family protein [Micropepsaceae bacterium]